MLIPLSWLQKCFSKPISLSEIYKAYDKIGIEIEAVHSEKFFFSKVVIGHVLETRPHPNADHLKIAMVDINTETLQIVCGAVNCRENIKVPVALVGSTLVPKGETQSITIKKSKIRGEISFGMICSHQELNIVPLFPTVKNGILELPPEAPKGELLSSFLSDDILELAITPNLGHCCSLIGLSREMAAVLPHLKLSYDDTSVNYAEASLQPLNFHIHSKDCFLYIGIVIKNVCVKPSALHILTTLESVKIKPINNIVDITNFVMLEQGQPLHAFDVAKVALDSLEVSNAEITRDLMCLNGETISLQPGTLVVQDKNGPLSLAGIMGGDSSKVTLSTTDVLLEAAVFSPQAIRTSSRNYSLHTDSSYRFERGLDPLKTLHALNRAVSLILASCPEAKAKSFFSRETKVFIHKEIALRLSAVHRCLGLSLSLEDLVEKLHLLGFICLKKTNDAVIVQVPSYRNDINQEIDLVEEVCRSVGFDNIGTQTAQKSITHSKSDDNYLFKYKLRKLLLKEELTECYCSDLIINEGNLLLSRDLFSHDKYIFLENNDTLKTLFLRPSLLQGLLLTATKNANHKLDSFCGFEIGSTYSLNHDSKYTEQQKFAFIGYGNKQPFSWEEKQKNLSFFDFKGMLENICSQLVLQKTISFAKTSYKDFHPYRQAVVLLDNRPIGNIGQIHPSLLKKVNFKLPTSVYFVECLISPLKKNAVARPLAKPIPLYPAIQRDWTVSVKQHIELGCIMKKILEKKSKWLESVSVISVYLKDKIDKEIKNVSLRFTYRDLNKTLLSKDIDNEHNKIIASLKNQMALENLLED